MLYVSKDLRESHLRESKQIMFYFVIFFVFLKIFTFYATFHACELRGAFFVALKCSFAPRLICDARFSVHVHTLPLRLCVYEHEHLMSVLIHEILA